MLIDKRFPPQQQQWLEDRDVEVCSKCALYTLALTLCLSSIVLLCACTYAENGTSRQCVEHIGFTADVAQARSCLLLYVMNASRAHSLYIQGYLVYEFVWQGEQLAS